MSATIIHGDCVEEMAKMPEASVDAVVCDPPYGLEFMGKEWDRLDDRDLRARGENAVDSANRGYNEGSLVKAPGFARTRAQAKAMQEWHEAWAREALRVLKPGGHLLAFGGTRTYHRLACAVEDAGFEIRDTISWVYGSGFPKSLDVSKAIDKAAGVEREVVGQRTDGRYAHGFTEQAKKALGGVVASESETGFTGVMGQITKPATPDAERWQGWGTALKPAHEPIVVARKPLMGTVAKNVLEHGTGALNIDACRIGATKDVPASVSRTAGTSLSGSVDGTLRKETGEEGGHNPDLGRWPANVVLSHADGCIPVGARKVKTGEYVGRNRQGTKPAEVYGTYNVDAQDATYADADGREEIEAWECVSGCPVAELDRQSGDRRSAGDYTKGNGRQGAKAGAASIPIDGQTSATYADTGGASRFFYVAKASSAERNAGLQSFDEEGNDVSVRNAHPTVKPVALMRWLVRMVTPPGGLVLDPFTGSGTTGIAAQCEGMSFIGIERDDDYIPVARARVKAWQAFRKGTPKRLKAQTAGQTQLSLE